MEWSVMPFNSLCQAKCFLRLKCFVQRCRCVCIEIVKNQSYFGHMSVFLIQQVFETLREIAFCPCFFHSRMPPTNLWFEHEEGATRPIARKFCIFACRMTGLCWYWRLHMSDQLARAFINADNRRSFIIRLHVYVQEILHTPHPRDTQRA